MGHDEEGIEPSRGADGPRRREQESAEGTSSDECGRKEEDSIDGRQGAVEGKEDETGENRLKQGAQQTYPENAGFRVANKP